MLRVEPESRIRIGDKRAAAGTVPTGVRWKRAAARGLSAGLWRIRAARHVPARLRGIGTTLSTGLHRSRRADGCMSAGVWWIGSAAGDPLDVLGWELRAAMRLSTGLWLKRSAAGPVCAVLWWVLPTARCLSAGARWERPTARPLRAGLGDRGVTWPRMSLHGSPVCARLRRRRRIRCRCGSRLTGFRLLWIRSGGRRCAGRPRIGWWRRRIGSLPRFFAVAGLRHGPS